MEANCDRRRSHTNPLRRGVCDNQKLFAILICIYHLFWMSHPRHSETSRELFYLHGLSAIIGYISKTMVECIFFIAKVLRNHVRK